MATITINASDSSYARLPITITYTPHGTWYRWSAFQNKRTGRFNLAHPAHPTAAIPTGAGVYEVRSTFRKKKHERLYIGSSEGQGLRSRIQKLFTGNAHDAHALVIGQVEKYVKDHPQAFQGQSIDPLNLLEITWSEFKKPERLELALHLVFTPKFPDKKFFPRGLL